MPKCPVCGAELIEVGFPKDFYQEYRCPNGCEFKPPLSWKIYNASAAVLTVVLYSLSMLLFLLLLPFVIVSERVKALRRK